jgi:hypothetical protein
MGRGIDALNDEMKAAGVRDFVGGLHPESSARPLRLQPAGKVLLAYVTGIGEPGLLLQNCRGGHSR